MKSKKRMFVIMLVIAGFLIPMIPTGTSEDSEYIDLTILDVEAWRQLVDKDKFNIRVRIKNNGNHHADAGFDVGLYQAVESIGGGFGFFGKIANHEVTVDLGAGQWRDIYFWGIYWKSVPFGAYRMQFSAFVDCNHEVIESNEDNNNFIDEVWWY
jgi:hypothetical protein